MKSNQYFYKNYENYILIIINNLQAVYFLCTYNKLKGLWFPGLTLNSWTVTIIIYCINTTDVVLHWLSEKVKNRRMRLRCDKSPLEVREQESLRLSQIRTSPGCLKNKVKESFFSSRRQISFLPPFHSNRGKTNVRSRDWEWIILPMR